MSPVRTVLACLLLGVPALPASAALVFAPTKITLKAKESDRTLGADYRFTNTGNAPVEIVRIETSCGCTVAAAEKSRYEPGESGTVAALYRVGTASGRQSHTITVTTNEDAPPRYVLTLEVELPRGVSTGVPPPAAPATPVTPTRLLWTRRPYAAKDVTVNLGSAARAPDVQVTCDKDGFAFEVRSSATKPEATIVVTPLADARVGQAEMTVSWEHRAGHREQHKVILRILPERTP